MQAYLFTQFWVRVVTFIASYYLCLMDRGLLIVHFKIIDQQSLIINH